MNSFGHRVLLASALLLAGCEVRIAESERNKVFECVSATERFTYNSNDARIYMTLGFEYVMQLKDSEGWERTMRHKDQGAWKCRQIR